MSLFEKAISPVVASVLLIVVAILAALSFKPGTNLFLVLHFHMSTHKVLLALSLLKVCLAELFL